MTHGQGQWWGLTVRGRGSGEQQGKNRDNCNRTTI